MVPSALPFYIREDDPPAKREILRAAMKLFSERGLAATTIRDIAEESGYTNPALYKHFASKEELALHLFETCHRRLWAACSAAIAAPATFDESWPATSAEYLRCLTTTRCPPPSWSDSARVLWPKAAPTIRSSER